MFNIVLLTLDGTADDRALVEEVKAIAKLAKSHVVVLFGRLGVQISCNYGKGAICADEVSYVKGICEEFRADGVSSEITLMCRDSVAEIVEQVRQKNCDLVVMTGRGHRSMFDFFFGDIANQVQQNVHVPVLIFPAA